MLTIFALVYMKPFKAHACFKSPRSVAGRVLRRRGFHVFSVQLLAEFLYKIVGFRISHDSLSCLDFGQILLDVL